MPGVAVQWQADLGPLRDLEPPSGPLFTTLQRPPFATFCDRLSVGSKEKFHRWAS